MRARVLMAIVAVVVVGGLRGAALQSVPTEMELDATMKEIRLTLGDAEGHIGSRYWPETEEDGQRLAAMFEQVEAFWTARETERAAGIAADAIAASRALTAAARRDDNDGATSAFDDLRGICSTCHQDYREQNEDGSYRVKPGS